MKRTLALFLSLMMVFSLFSGLNITAGAAETDVTEAAAEAEVTESTTESELPELDLQLPEPESETEGSAAKADLAEIGAEPDLADTGATYELWLGSTQVTDANKSDILGDGGKAKFDPSTHILTLNNPTINGEHNYSKIFCNGFDLTVKGSYTMTFAQSDNALTVFDHDLTLDGNFTLLAWCYAVETSYDIYVNGGRVTAKLEEGDSESCQAFCSDAGSITFGDNVEYFEAAVTSTWNTVYAVGYSSEGTAAVSPKLKLTTPEGGSFREGSCYYYESGKQKRAKTVIIEPADPTDIKYEVWVGATQVTGANKNDILGDGGKAKYDPSTATLTLNNPTISTNYSSGGKTHKIYAAEDITVKGSYTMTSYSADYGIYGYMNLTLDGDFTILSGIHGVYARFKLTIYGSLVGRANSTTYTSSAGIKASQIKFGEITRVEAEGKKAMAIYAERGLTIPPKYEITTPSASYIENGTVVDNAASQIAKRVVIEPVTDGLGVYLGEKQVTESNKDDIFGDGKASYDIDTKTLTINYPTIRGCYTTLSGNTAVIYSKDDLTVTGNYNRIDYSYHYGIYCEKNLTINADNIIIGSKNDAIRSLKTLTLNGYDDGVLIAKAHSSDADLTPTAITASKLTIGTGLTHLEAEGDSFAIFCNSFENINEDIQLTTPDGGIFKNNSIHESDGTTIAKKVVFTCAYKLWLGETRVTEKNKDDILGDGKAKYDPNTQTLTLNDPKILYSSYEVVGTAAKIYAESIDLSMVGSYHIPDNEIHWYGVYIKDGSLSLNGNFSFIGSMYGATVFGGNMNINGGSVKSTSTGTAAIYSDQNLTIGASVKSVTATGEDYGILTKTGVSINGGAVTVTGETSNGIGTGGDINITGGSVTAEGGNNAISTGQSINISNSSVDAKGGKNGINANQSVTISGSATRVKTLGEEQRGINAGNSFTVSGGTVIADGKLDGIWVVKYLQIKGGSVSATSQTSDGIYVREGNIDITGGTVNAKGMLNGIATPNSLTIGPDVDSVTAEGNERCGISTNHGITVNGGRIHAYSTAIQGICCNDGDIVLNGGVIYATGGERGLYSQKSIKLNSGLDYLEVKGSGYAITYYEDFFMSDALERIAYDSDHSVYMKKTLHKYNLWLGGVQVNEANRFDIFGDGGKAKYDPETKTLTMDDPQPFSAMVDPNDPSDSYQLIAYDDLTIKGVYKPEQIRNTGIQVIHGNLTLDGDIAITANSCGAYVVGDTNVSGKIFVKGEKVTITCLNPSSQNYAIRANNLTVCPEAFYFCADGGINAYEGIKIDGSLRITAPTNNKFVDGKIYEADGITPANYVVIEKGSSSFKLGDVDRNGDVEIRDATWIQRDAADIDIPFAISKKTADIDGDGEITVMDATAIQYYLANMKTSYPIGEPV